MKKETEIRIKINEGKDGERLTTRIKRMIKTGGAPEKEIAGGEKFYTVAQAGVLPETNIRTNTMDVIMDAIHTTTVAKGLQNDVRDYEPKSRGEKKTPPDKDGGAPELVK